MIILRSILFQIAYVILSLMWFIGALPTLLLPMPFFKKYIGAGWSASTIWLFEKMIGVTHEVRGVEHLPAGPSLIASKHLSAWETIFLCGYIPNSNFILKRELLRIPLFGLYLKKSGSIPIDRQAGVATLVAMSNATRKSLAEGHQVIIFPEGTRRPVDAEPDYKTGVALLYSQAGVDCVLLAHNSGLVWPRKGIIRYPGHVIVEFLPAIPAGLPKKVFLAEMTERIETASQRLIAEGRKIQAQRMKTAA